MKKYKVTFIGKKKGAIGISYRHEIIVEVENDSQIKLKLYETHDHINHETIRYEEIK